MPELPEVETIRRSLAPLVEGRRMAELEVGDPRWCAPLAPEEIGDAVLGRTVEALTRRGKWLVFELEGEVFLITHLRMTGAFLYDPDPARAVRAGADAAVRRSRAARSAIRGASAPGSWRSARPRWRRSSPRASGSSRSARTWTAPSCTRLARGSRAPVKAFLLDQKRIAGVGNIYADEALFRARHPPAAAGRSADAGAGRRRSRGTVRDALTAGLAAGGATIDDFRHPDGVRGTFQDEFLVHRREGEDCPRCGGEIVKLVVAGRGTYVCERCQPRPRGVRRPERAPRGARSGRP